MSQTLSVVIPSYRNPEYLDLCLRSAFEGMSNECQRPQIIVVLDGYGDESKHVLAKYPDVDVLEFEENKGQMVAHNSGVMLAEGEFVLIVNDDNVFPQDWNARLVSMTLQNVIVTPNQIEPRQSIFKSFIQKDLGITPDAFDLQTFREFEHQVSRPWAYSEDGQTWPILLPKKVYMMLGGIDQNFPSAAVADWDFFLRAELAGVSFIRSHGVHFYHFAGAATRKTDATWNEKEQQSFEYFAYKWGFYPRMDAETHTKNPAKFADPIPVVRGVRF